MKISDLSLKEKVLQTVVIRVDKDNFVSDQVGAAFFFGEIITEADEMGMECAKQTLAQYIDNAKVPILITSDFENGCGSMLKGLTPLPYLMSLGATNSEEIAYHYGKATALEARSVGANWSFSPVSDLNINKRNPLVNVRGISDDPDLAIRLLKQVVRGMQENGLAACAKHFPGDGLDYRDQHIVTTNNTLAFDDWKKLSGRVFQELIDDGVYSIMAGHITLPEYQKEIFKNGMKLPATLSGELINGLLKKEMGYQGVVVSDSLNMGGFLGWYPTKQQSEVEAFKAGCDMVLWPTKDYVKNMTEAIENGYVSMERLDDAVNRILTMKEKLGLFRKDNHAITLSDEDKKFIKNTQQETAEHSITLIRDEKKLFPIKPEETKKIAVIPVTHHTPALEEAVLLCEELRHKGFTVTYLPDGIKEADFETHDVVLYALFSRPFRPIGFQDFHSAEAYKVLTILNFGAEKTVVVSFGSPYFGEQYFERAHCYVNAYSMLSPSVKAFVRAATGEIPFTSRSPVEL
ncbi:MAG: glycoside hydrolase family 3 N-terminal domain-containing protein [Clostridia bacterium]|nr:glycoside hydrolase family 3 N-terminal domain-containing protein [Clostridia bacterium]